MKNKILIPLIFAIGLILLSAKAHAGLFDIPPECQADNWRVNVVHIDSDGNKLWRANHGCGNYPIYYVTSPDGGRTMSRHSSGKSSVAQEVQTLNPQDWTAK